MLYLGETCGLTKWQQIITISLAVVDPLGWELGFVGWNEEGWGLMLPYATRVFPYPTLPYTSQSYPTQPYTFLPNPTLRFPTLPISYPTRPDPTWPNPTLPHNTLPETPTLSYLPCRTIEPSDKWPWTLLIIIMCYLNLNMKSFFNYLSISNRF